MCVSYAGVEAAKTGLSVGASAASSAQHAHGCRCMRSVCARVRSRASSSPPVYMIARDPGCKAAHVENKHALFSHPASSASPSGRASARTRHRSRSCAGRMTPSRPACFLPPKRYMCNQEAPRSRGGYAGPSGWSWQGCAQKRGARRRWHCCCCVGKLRCAVCAVCTLQTGVCWAVYFARCKLAGVNKRFGSATPPGRREGQPS